MTLELDGQKVGVTGGKRELDRTIAEADEGADVVIWMRQPKISGIKSRGIGKDGCEAIRQAPTTNQ